MLKISLALEHSLATEGIIWLEIQSIFHCFQLVIYFALSLCPQQYPRVAKRYRGNAALDS